jgi:hypothetical protein
MEPRRAYTLESVEDIDAAVREVIDWLSILDNMCRPRNG